MVTDNTDPMILGAYEGHIPDTIGKPDLLVLGNQMASAIESLLLLKIPPAPDGFSAAAVSAWREATR